MLLVSGILAILVVSRQIQPIHARDIFQRIRLQFLLRNDSFGYQTVQRIHGAVGVGITVLVTVAELQMRPGKQGFAVTQISTSVVTLRGIDIILVHIGAVVPSTRLTLKEVVHVRDVERLVVRIGITAPHPQGKVAPLAVQPTVHHQHPVHGIALAVAMAPTPVVIHHDAVRHIIAILRKRIGHAPCIRVIVKRHTAALPVAVILRERKVRTEHDARHRVRRPFEPEI